MSNVELINKINEYVFDNNENDLLNILNYLMLDKRYKDYLQEIFALISITEMYGYLAYLSSKEIDDFLIYDSARSQTYLGKNISYYNKGQLSLLYDFDKYKKVFLSAPTSFGKTSIVLEYILCNFEKFDNVMFIVPTNSLLEELYQKVSRLNKNLQMNYHVSTQPYIKNSKRNFLILTPERFFLVSETISINDFDLIIMDETYKIVDSKDKQISDFLESRSLRFRKVADMIGSSNKKTIFLSPFTYYLTESMEKFLTKYNIKKLIEKWNMLVEKLSNCLHIQTSRNILKMSRGINKKFRKQRKQGSFLRN